MCIGDRPILLLNEDNLRASIFVMLECRSAPPLGFS